MNQPVKRKKKFSYLSAVLSISMVLLMLGLFGMLVIASRSMQTYLRENMVIHVFLDPAATAEETAAVKSQIEGQEFLKSLDFTSKEKAATDFGNELGQDFVSFLGYNPLMGSFQVKIKEEFNNAENLVQVENTLRRITGVKEVSYQAGLYQIANKNVSTIGMLFIMLAGFFTVIAIVLIHNTVKLNLYARRFIIKSMQLVGATNWFIMKPFVWQAVKNGIWGWLLSLLMLAGVNQLIPMVIPEWSQIELGESIWMLFGLLFLTGMLISLASSLISTRKYLNTRLEDLY